MMGRPPRLKREDIPRIKIVMAQMETPTQAQVASVLGVKYDTFRHFVNRNRDEFPHELFTLPTRANGLAGRLFEAARQGRVSMAHISRELGVNPSSVHNWRVRRGEMSLFHAQCFADLVGLQLTLLPKEPSL